MKIGLVTFLRKLFHQNLGIIACFGKEAWSVLKTLERWPSDGISITHRLRMHTAIQRIDGTRFAILKKMKKSRLITILSKSPKERKSRTSFIMTRFHLLTLFKDACEPYLNASILGRARKTKKISISYQNPRDFVENKWGKVDERPYGGGPGMVMQALPVVKAAAKVLARARGKKVIVWFVPGEKQFTNAEADKLMTYDDIIFVCGRYEGIDERALSILKTLAPVKKYAVGEAVYTGGEVPALAMIDAITRRIPGVLGKDESIEERRVASRQVFTRPETILWKKKKYKVPAVLQTGNHKNINAWRSKKS